MYNQDIIKYWVDSSDEDYKTAQNLLLAKDYFWSLFIGHLVIEKLLKGLIVSNNQNTIPPFTHDLLRLANKLDIEINDDYKEYLDTISTFNINARYDDYKLNFKKKCNKEFAEHWFSKINMIREWLKSQF
jgi:HEPN domain-containing protein